MWEYELDRAGSRYGQLAGTCDCGNEPSGSIQCGEFLDKLKTVSFSRRILLHGVRKLDGVCSQRRPLCPRGETLYPLYRRLGGAPAPVWTGAENLATTGIFVCLFDPLFVILVYYRINLNTLIV